MVYFEKSQPSPTITSSHNTPEIIDRLKIDFYNKCYICEEKEPKDINVEHFVSHRGNDTLRLDWNNLFLSCAHCNNVKSDDYNNLLDCTILGHSVDKNIRYYCDPMPKEKPIFTIINTSPQSIETKELLEKCFNGEHTGQKTLESSNLRSKLLCEIRKFQNLIIENEETPDDYYLIKIKFHLSKESAFTAFKRWIIWDKPYLTSKYAQYIID